MRDQAEQAPKRGAEGAGARWLTSWLPGWAVPSRRGDGAEPESGRSSSSEGPQSPSSGGRASFSESSGISRSCPFSLW